MISKLVLIWNPFIIKREKDGDRVEMWAVLGKTLNDSNADQKLLERKCLGSALASEYGKPLLNQKEHKKRDLDLPFISIHLVSL